MDIPDPYLRAAIEAELGKASGATITTADIANLPELRAEDADITDLTGLEHATNLISLSLDRNNISDISPLAGLTNLISLSLDRNNISDISPLAGLTNLTYLYLYDNSIADISPVAGLTNLTGLYLDNNSIADISPLAGLTNLTGLNLGFNSIADISPLAGLNKLTDHLYLYDNSISDISPLAGLNKLTDLYLSNNSIADISPLAGLNKLTDLDLWGNSISDISPLAGLTHLTFLGLGYNSIADISPLVANTGLGNDDTVYVKGNPLNSASINTHIPVLQRRGVTVEFDAVVAQPEDIVVDIPDPNLRAAVEAELGKASGDAITADNMEALTILLAPNANISDLTGLERATNLRVLNLGAEEAEGRFINSNSISDLSPLAGLRNLGRLGLDYNSISDISPLTGLTNLTGLVLAGNSISDISLLAGLTRLTTLGLWENSISDISSLAGLTRLTDLRLRTNNITDLLPLAGLTNLTWLDLGNNSISDISHLEGLTNLTTLNLEINSISDISHLAGLTRLTTLDLEINSISDISPLVANTGLGNGDAVGVSGNPLNSISINTHIPALVSRGVTVHFGDIVIEPETVDIPDPNLRAAIEAKLGKASGATIATNDMATLTILLAPNANISDLTGLEHATNLRVLNLGAVEEEGRFINSNSISDISPLRGLTNLTGLEIENNSISDLSSLTGLTKLTILWLHNNSVADISPLTGLTNLTTLVLNNNSIADISPLAGLTQLRQLSLRDNSISDISPLARLTQLTLLGLNNNSIAGISPLARLTKLTTLVLNNNSIADISSLAGLTNLTHLGLDSNSISDISSLAGLTNLTHLGLDSNSVSDLSPLAGLTNLTFLDLDKNSISDLSPLVANTGLGNGDVVGVNGNPLNSASINTHIPALVSRGVTVYFGDIVIEPETVDIPDPNLRAAIEAKLGKASGTAITADEMATLTRLLAPNANISDLTGLEHATNLRALNLGDVEVEGGFINSNSVSDLSPLAGLTRLTKLGLENNSIANISPLAGLTNLTDMEIGGNKITDVSSLAGLTKLTLLWLNNNSIADISPLTGLTNLKTLVLENNSISDISPLAGLTNLTQLRLYINPISDISPLAGLTKLTSLGLGRNNISDISPLAGLTNLTTLTLWTNSISDLSPLVANTGLGKGDRIDVSENPLNSASINTHIPALQRRGVEVYFENLKPTTPEYLLSIPAGISLIHVPLKVTTVDGVPKTIESISNLYDALGGASKVNFLITYDSQAQEWRSYFGASDTGTPADRVLTDDMGITAGMIAPASISLSGSPLGTNGSGTITINPGLNLVGLPLNDSGIKRVSALFALEGIGGNVPVIILTDGGEFKVVGRAGDPGDIPIVGGQAFIMTAQRAATVTISGDGWTNTSGTAAAPPLSLTGIEVGDTTPVLGLRGAIVDQGTGVNQVGLRVTVKNLSTRRAVAAVTGPDEAGYRLAVVDIETGRAATIGDTLEISAQSPNPFIGVKPLRYTVTAEDVKQSLIQLPELVAYEIPAETELLHNYPNPFNPETWIPYRLAEDAFVTLTIYDQTGQIVRTLDVGHQIASVYENRSRAIYWDGRNDVGEQVASGVYFYHLFAGDYSATRKMLILK